MNFPLLNEGLQVQELFSNENRKNTSFFFFWGGGGGISDIINNELYINIQAN